VALDGSLADSESRRDDLVGSPATMPAKTSRSRADGRERADHAAATARLLNDVPPVATMRIAAATSSRLASFET
jgi:hypothetical protein